MSDLAVQGEILRREVLNRGCYQCCLYSVVLDSLLSQLECFIGSGFKQPANSLLGISSESEMQTKRRFDLILPFPTNSET